MLTLPNIGFNLAGMIAERATGDGLATLFGERILRPLGLRRTAYDPQRPIAGRHARGYADNGAMVDVSDEHVGKGADGGITSDAATPHCS